MAVPLLMKTQKGQLDVMFLILKKGKSGFQMRSVRGYQRDVAVLTKTGHREMVSRLIRIISKTLNG